MTGLHLALTLSLLAGTPSPLSTVAERSGFTRTGRYDEVERLCHEFAARYPKQVRCETFGVTPEHRPMQVLIASADGTLSPELARQRKRSVVMAQGGIHAGEIDGKDAGFLLLRELLEGKAGQGVLEKVTFVFVPVFNVDGHERVSAFNRPNQRGPEQMGWRVNAQNLNLNRDYAKADTPEMRAMLRLLGAWDPILYLDLHVTDGSKFQHEVAILLEPQNAGAENMRPVGRAAREAVFAELKREGHTPLEFYPSLIDEDDPSSGFKLGVSPPRFSQGYWSLRNRFGVLVETHSWKTYPVRVKTTHDVLLAFLEQAAQHGGEWLDAAAAADAADRHPASLAVPLTWETTPESHPIDFLGYAYTREPSEVSGKYWVRYDESKPAIWRVPYFSVLQPKEVATAPAGGYVVHAGFADLVAERLRLHGFRYDVLVAPRTVELEVYRSHDPQFAKRSFEGHQTVELPGTWQKEQVLVPAGSLYVPADQPGRTLLAELLDPAGPDSLGQWGYFNPMFEQKEYLEDYVVEAFAREAMKKDPKLRKAFEAKLKTDPAFAKDPRARLRFFAERHPAWDKLLGRYPVFKAAGPLKVPAAK